MAKKHSNKLDFDTGWHYDPAPESPELAKLKDCYDLFIDGKFVKPSEWEVLRHDQPFQSQDPRKSG